MEGKSGTIRARLNAAKPETKVLKIMMKSALFRFCVILFILIASSLLIIANDADLRIARLIFGADHHWPGNVSAFWVWLYDVAPIPGILLAGGSLMLFCAGFFVHKLKRFRRQAAFIVLLALLGPGLVVNTLLKNQLGRPRPREVTEFGGEYPFVQPGFPGTAGSNSSFPSGHASIAFFLIAPWFSCRSSRRMIAFGFLSAGLGYGLLVGFGRMMQGAHFLSDILWAGGLVYLTGEILSPYLLTRSPRPGMEDGAASL